MVISLLTYASLPSCFLSFAFTTIAFLINRFPSFNLQHLSPFEKLFHRLPDYKHLKVFGCSCFPLLKSYISNKLQPKTSKCIFLGYPLEYKRVFMLQCNMSNGKLFTFRHVIFYENSFPFSLPFSPYI